MKGLKILAAGIAMGLASLLAPPASAAPAGLGALDSAGLAKVATEKVHSRGFRHCHWRDGDRWCHGRRYYRGRGPGINLYIGPGRRSWRQRRGSWRM